MTKHEPSPAGEVRIDGDTATLIFERELAHPPEAVWRALTDPDELGAWLATEARIDGRAGGTVEMITGPVGMRWTGAILEWDPPRVFAYEWNLDPREEIPTGERTVVTWTLTETEGGTRLSLTHTRLTRPTALGFAPGTHAFLDRLEAHLAGEAIPDWMARYQAVASFYPAWAPGG